MNVDELPTADPETGLRDRALASLKKRRDFHTHLVVYALVNGVIVAIWALTTPHGFFWPMFPMLAWGIGLVLNAWDVYRGEDFTEDEVQREIARLRGHG